MQVNRKKVEEHLGLESDVPFGALLSALGFVGGPAVAAAGLMTPLWPRDLHAGLWVMVVGLGLLGIAISQAIPRTTQKRNIVWIDPTADKDGLILGVTADRRFVTWPKESQAMHLALVGGSGAGKTTLMTSALVWPKILSGAAVIMIDAKPEDETLRQLVWMAKAAGRLDQLYCLQPDRALRSHTMNVLKQGGGVVEQVDLLMGLRPLEDSSTTIYYSQAQYDVISGIIAALHDTGLDYHPGDVVAAVVSSTARADLLSWKASDGAKELQMVLDEFRGRGGAFDEERWMRELKGIVVILKQYLRVAGPILKHEEGEIDLYRILKEGGIFYLPLPTGQAAKMAQAWARLVMKCLIAACGKLIREGHRPSEPAIAVLDEFGAYCSSDAAFAFGWARAASLGIVASYQAAAQLRHVGPEIEEIINENTFYKVFMRHGGEPGAEDSAAQLGKTMKLRRSYSLSNSAGESWGMRASESRNEGAGLSGREDYEFKVMPEEFRCLPRGGAFVGWEGNQAKMKAPLFRVSEDELLGLDDLVGPPLRGKEIATAGRTGYHFPIKTGGGIGLWRRYEREVERKLGQFGRAEESATRKGGRGDGK